MSRPRESLVRGADRVLPAAIPALVMLGFGLWGIGRDSTYSAEAITYWAAGLPLSALWRLVQNVDAFHAVYYLLIHLVFDVRRSLVTMRLPSVAASVASVVLTYALMVRLTGRRWVACLAATLLAVSPGMSEFAQDGRSYALDCMLALVATWALLHALDAAGPGQGRAEAIRAWVPYVASLTVLGYLHELTMGLLLTGHLAGLLMTRRRRILPRWLLSTACALVLTAPLVLLTLHQEAGSSPVIARPSRTNILEVVHMVFGFRPAVAVVMIGLAVVGAWPWRAPAAYDEVRRWATSILVVPVVVLLVESWLAKPLFIDRYLLFVAPWAMVLVTLGVLRLAALAPAARRTAVVVGIGVVLVAVAVGLQVSTQQWLRTPVSRGWDLHADAEYLAQHARSGDGVDYVPRSLGYVHLSYPRLTQRLVDFRMCETPAAAGRLHGVACSAKERRQRLRRLDRVWILYDPGSGNFARRGIRSMGPQFHRVSDVPSGNERIALYVRNP